MDPNQQNRSLFRQCLAFFLVLLRKLYDLLCDIIFAFIFSSAEVKKIPPCHPLLRESAVTLAEKIRNRTVRENLEKNILFFEIREKTDFLYFIIYLGYK